MEKWEYLTTFLQANAESEAYQRAVKLGQVPKNVSKYAVQATIPALNALGADGWELVHMEPIQAVGKSGDVGFGTTSISGFNWSNTYFCVFKRKI